MSEDLHCSHLLRHWLKGKLFLSVSAYSRGLESWRQPLCLALRAPLHQVTAVGNAELLPLPEILTSLVARQTSSRLIPSNTHPLRLPGTSWEVNCLQAMQFPLGASENGAVPEGTKDSPQPSWGPQCSLSKFWLLGNVTFCSI